MQGCYMKHVKNKPAYDRAAVGMRLRSRRNQKGWSRGYVAERIGVGERYYADIERGTCGMSIETLIALTELYGISMDFLIYGEQETAGTLSRDKPLIKALEALSLQQQNVCLELLTLFVNGLHAEEKSGKEKAPARSAGRAAD